MAGSDKHPSDTLIIDKAKGRACNTSKDSQPQADTAGQKADKKGTKRKRSLDSLALNISNEGKYTLYMILDLLVLEAKNILE